MTYSNFARRKGSKDKGKRVKKTAINAGKLLGVGALGYAALKNRDALGALGSKVAERATNAVKAGASLGSVAGDMAKSSASNAYKGAKTRVGGVYQAAKGKAKEVYSNVRKKKQA